MKHKFPVRWKNDPELEVSRQKMLQAEEDLFRYLDKIRVLIKDIENNGNPKGQKEG